MRNIIRAAVISFPYGQRHKTRGLQTKQTYAVEGYVAKLAAPHPECFMTEQRS